MSRPRQPTTQRGSAVLLLAALLAPVRGWSAESPKATEHAPAAAPRTEAPAPAAAGTKPSPDPRSTEARPEGKPDVKPEGKPESKPEGKPEPKPAVSRSKPVDAAPMPPSLTSSALRQELSRGGAAAGPLSEQQRLEALVADLVRAREALRAETTRLETLLRNPPAPGTTGATPGRENLLMPSGNPTGAGPPRAEPAAPPTPNQVEVVAKAFRGMKPEQAAALIGHLDRGLAAEVLLRMRPADAGAILGFLRPELGAALATEIARQPAPSKPKGPAKAAP